MNAFTWIFLVALVASTLTQLWLAQRQIRHVRAHRGAVPDMFGDAIPLSAHQKAADYTVEKTHFGMLGIGVSASVLLALTLGGGIQILSNALADVLERGGLWHGTALLLGIVLVMLVVNLPLGLYRIFVIEERYGFNRMTLALFLTDFAKQLVLGLALGVPLILAILWLMQQTGEYWWLYAWLVLTGYSIFLQLIIPTLILPWFNKFTPLTEGELTDRVRALLERCGFKSRGVFSMDGSKRSSHGNAFFAGFGAAKRIVLFDTLIDRLAPGEVEAVLAHELGHYRLHHIVKMIVINAAITLVGLWALGQLIDQDWFYQGLGVATPSLAAALALFVLAVPRFTFFLEPLESLLSRKHEFEADAYAVKYADRADLGNALVKLYKDNAATLTPDPLHSAFYDSHPPASARIARLKTI